MGHTSSCVQVKMAKNGKIDYLGRGSESCSKVERQFCLLGTGQVRMSRKDPAGCVLDPAGCVSEKFLGPARVVSRVRLGAYLGRGGDFFENDSHSQ